jgi:hypothetical protein
LKKDIKHIDTAITPGKAGESCTDNTIYIDTGAKNLQRSSGSI